MCSHKHNIQLYLIIHFEVSEKVNTSRSCSTTRTSQERDANSGANIISTSHRLICMCKWSNTKPHPLCFLSMSRFNYVPEFWNDFWRSCKLNLNANLPQNTFRDCYNHCVYTVLRNNIFFNSITSSPSPPTILVMMFSDDVTTNYIVPLDIELISTHSPSTSWYMESTIVLSISLHQGWQAAHREWTLLSISLVAEVEVSMLTVT